MHNNSFWYLHGTQNVSTSKKDLTSLIKIFYTFVCVYPQ